MLSSGRLLHTFPSLSPCCSLFLKPAVKVSRHCCWDILLSRQISDAIKHIVDHNLVFKQDGQLQLPGYNPAAAKSSTPLILKI